MALTLKIETETFTRNTPAGGASPTPSSVEKGSTDHKISIGQTALRTQGQTDTHPDEDDYKSPSLILLRGMRVGRWRGVGGDKNETKVAMMSSELPGCNLQLTNK